jgi:hypothetical protein
MREKDHRVRKVIKTARLAEGKEPCDAEGN